MHSLFGETSTRILHFIESTLHSLNTKDINYFDCLRVCEIVFQTTLGFSVNKSQYNLLKKEQNYIRTTMKGFNLNQR